MRDQLIGHRPTAAGSPRSRSAYRNGRRRRKPCVGATRGAVAAQLTHALHDHQHGLPVAPDRQTVDTWLTRWLEDSVKPSVRPTTYRSSQQVVDRHLTPGLGRDPLATLTPPPGADLSQRPAPRRTDPHVVSGPGVPADAHAAHGPVHPRCAPAGAQSGDALGSGLAQCRDPGDPAAGHPTGGPAVHAAAGPRRSRQDCHSSAVSAHRGGAQVWPAPRRGSGAPVGGRSRPRSGHAPRTTRAPDGRLDPPARRTEDGAEPTHKHAPGDTRHAAPRASHAPA